MRNLAFACVLVLCTSSCMPTVSSESSDDSELCPAPSPFDLDEAGASACTEACGIDGCMLEMECGEEWLSQPLDCSEETALICHYSCGTTECSFNVHCGDIAVLGLHAELSNDDLAHRFTEHLRSITPTDRWTVRRRQEQPTTIQMLLAFGCDENVTTSCLHDIAEAMGVEVLIFGYLDEEGPNTYKVMVSRYHRAFDLIAGTSIITIREDADDEELAQTAAQVLGGL